MIIGSYSYPAGEIDSLDVSIKVPGPDILMPDCDPFATVYIGGQFVHYSRWPRHIREQVKICIHVATSKSPFMAHELPPSETETLCTPEF